MPQNSKTPTVSSRDLRKLQKFLLDRARLCIHEPTGSLASRYVTPTFAVNPGSDDKAEVSERSSVGHYLQMYDWDSCFFSQAAQRLGVPDLPLDVVRNFLSLRQSDGYTPRTVSPGRIWDKGDQCKPFLCQTIQSSTTGAVPADLLDGLDSYLGYFVSKRRHESGLYQWRNVLESGVDNNLALLAPAEAAKDENSEHTNFPDGRLLACDLSAYLFAEFRAFAEIAGRSSRADLADKYLQLANEVQQAIERNMWVDSLSIYCNLDPVTLQPVTLRCWTGLVPALTGAASKTRTAAVIENNILSQEHFLRPAGIASVAVSERLYNQARRGLYGRVLVSNWQGPVWVLPNVLVARCLKRNGYLDGARSVAARMIKALVRDVRKNDSLHENYHAETGEPLFAPQFMSWNVLALELIDVLA